MPKEANSRRKKLDEHPYHTFHSRVHLFALTMGSGFLDPRSNTVDGSLKSYSAGLSAAVRKFGHSVGSVAGSVCSSTM